MEDSKMKIDIIQQKPIRNKIQEGWHIITIILAQEEIVDEG